MFTLVLIGVVTSGANVTSVAIPGFSSNVTCIEAGKEFVKSPHTFYALDGSGTSKECGWWSYNCIEVK